MRGLTREGSRFRGDLSRSNWFLIKAKGDYQSTFSRC